MFDVPTLVGQFEPVAISSDRGDWFADCLDALRGGEDASDLKGAIKQYREDQSDAAKASEDGFWPEEGHWMCRYRPYIVRDGVLHIPIAGALVPNFPYTLGSWITGYEYITRAILRGQDDEGVKGIALIVNSGGGYVSGCMDCGENIYAAREKKPIRAFAKDHGYSAAYWLASCAHDISVPQLGGVGSIGVIATHIDISEMMENAGVRVTLITAGKKKADTSPYRKLTKAARARIQERVDHSNEVFAATVARNRGMSAEEVKAFEADTFMAHEAVENGLADEIGSFDDAVAAFAASLSQETGGDTMSQEDNTAVDQAAHEEAVNTARSEGVAEGKAQGATEERQRISAILESDEAKARPTAAHAVAMHDSKSVDEAKAFLAMLPEEGAKAEEEESGTKDGANDPFSEAMDKSDNPDLGAGEPAGGEGAKGGDGANVTSIMGDYRTATGRSSKSA